MEKLLKKQKTHKYYRLIELLAFWEGGVNATDIATYFKFTNKQGKQYLGQYKQCHTTNLIYDASLKKFQPSNSFQPYYIDQVVNEYLDWLHPVSTQSVPVDNYLTDTSTRLPARQVSPQTMRALVYAIKHQQAVDTQYASLNHPKGEWRLIHPHTFVKTGLRWHLRGYSEKHDDYRDFVLSRFSDDTSLDNSRDYRPKHADIPWNTEVHIMLAPNPKLSKAQQQLIADDYNMKNQQLPLQTKGALVHYLLQEMQVDVSQAHNAAKQPLVVTNLSAIQCWLFDKILLKKIVLKKKVDQVTNLPVYFSWVE